MDGFMNSVWRVFGLTASPATLASSKWARKIWRLEKEWRRKLPEADFVVVSFAKSGRTWLRAMVSRLYQRRYELPAGLLLSHDNMHALNPAVPVCFFTHDGDPMGSVASLRRNKRAYDAKPVLYLMRHPFDVAVSHYFQMKHRKAGRRAGMAEGMSMFDFIMRPGLGLEMIIEYTNLWYRYVVKRPNALLVRYEDLKADPVGTMTKVCDFLGADFDRAAIEEAVEFCSFANLQKREREGFYENGALRPADPSNPNSFKVRRGKVGGYRDYFSAAELEAMSTSLRNRLDKEIGYVA
jgi:alcohol sulfotransferase